MFVGVDVCSIRSLLLQVSYIQINSCDNINCNRAVCREFGVHIGRVCLFFQIFAAGMFVSSTAFLPSSFAMYTFAAACAAWWQQRYPLAIFFTALGSLLGNSHSFKDLFYSLSLQDGRLLHY